MQESEDLVVLGAESAKGAQEYAAVVIFSITTAFLYFTGVPNVCGTLYRMVKLDLNYRGGLWNKTT